MITSARTAHAPTLPVVHRTLLNLGVLLVATAVAAVSGEIVVRELYGNEINLYPRFHTRAIYGAYEIRRLRPNTVFWHTSRDGSWKFHINAQGFRASKDYAYAKPAGTTRVLALGDSQTLGFEVRQSRTYAAVIERYLKKRGVAAEALNTGVSGFGTAEALVFLENEGIRYEPDAVVLGFFANDFGDNVKSALFALEDGKLVEKNRVYAPGVGLLDKLNGVAPLRWLSENSYLYSAALNSVWEGSKRALLSQRRAELATEYALPDGGTTDGYEKQLALALVRRMYSFCREHGVELVIVDIPRPTRSGFAPSVPADLVPSFRQNSDAYIDSTEIFAPYDGVAEMFVPHGQRHMSEFSHLLIGMTAANFVLQHRAPGDAHRS